MKNQKGYTLLEVILAMAIGFMLMAVIWSILGLGVRSQSFTANEYEEQANMRYAIETINNRMRFFTVGFAVTKEDFKPSYNDSGELEGVVAPWSYIGLSPDKTHLVHYEYKEDGYVTTDLTLPVEGLDLDLRFIKESNPQDDNLLTLLLKGYKNEQETFDIQTTIDAINALHLIDWGDGTHDGAAVALAYRTEDTPEIDKRPVAAMSMVLDTSGSMEWDLDGNDNASEENQRISILKERLKIMLADLSIGENVYASLTPFHTNANIPNTNISQHSVDNVTGFTKITKDNLGDETEGWRGLVNSLKADGGTNTGDGLRRSYYQLADFNQDYEDKESDNNQEIKNYMVLLVDGETTMASANVYRRQSGYEDWYKYWYNNWNWEWRWQNTNEYYYEFLDAEDKINNYKSNRENGWLRGYTNFDGIKSGFVETSDNRLRLVEENAVIGNGVFKDVIGTEYVDYIGQMIINDNEQLHLEDNIFIIGFSNREDDLGSIQDIAESLRVSNEHVFIANDEDALEETFKDIGGYISEDLWQVSGPRLEP